MNHIQEQFESLIQKAVLEKDIEIKSLKEQNEKLREENEKLLKQIGYGDIKNKAETLKKALDDFLEHPNQNRPSLYNNNRLQPQISIPNSSNVDAKPSTSTRPDEPSVNGARYPPNRPNFNNVHEDFSANPDHQHQHQHFHSHLQTNVPTTYNNQKRFQNGYPNGMNNNNNNRNNRNNNNNNSNKLTIFVSWPGSATKEQLHELFESEGIDVADIRYTALKQFAHVDLKSEHALSKAITLNGVTRNEKQGMLRVEVGKPRSNNPNPTENGQRPQNQNKNYNRQNNKNPNGYNNTSSPQKQNKYPYNPNHNNNHNNNHNGFSTSFATTDDKENSLSWQNLDGAKQETN